jgi:hypothetical protein
MLLELEKLMENNQKITFTTHMISKKLSPENSSLLLVKDTISTVPIKNQKISSLNFHKFYVFKIHNSKGQLLGSIPSFHWKENWNGILNEKKS